MQSLRSNKYAAVTVSKLKELSNTKKNMMLNIMQYYRELYTEMLQQATVSTVHANGGWIFPQQLSDAAILVNVSLMHPEH